MMVDFFFSPDCSLSYSFLRGFVYMVQLSTRMEAQRFIQPPTGRHSDSTDSRTRSSPTFADSVSVSPKCFNGDARMFKEWCFSVELALRSRNIEVDFRQVEFASSCLEGNALLWLIACQESGTTFNSWKDLRSALAKTFGPQQRAEEDRLDLFSLRQVSSLKEYIQDFTRLSLSITGLDEHSLAVLFVKGLQPSLQAEALREHPRTLSDAFIAARMAYRQLVFSDQSDWKLVSSRGSNKVASAPATMFKQPHLGTKLDDDLRRKLMREGRCFKCRQVGHISRNCPERDHPNVNRQGM